MIGLTTRANGTGLMLQESWSPIHGISISVISIISMLMVLCVGHSWLMISERSMLWTLTERW